MFASNNEGRGSGCRWSGSYQQKLFDLKFAHSIHIQFFFRYAVVSSSISFWLPSAGIIYFYYQVRIFFSWLFSTVTIFYIYIFFSKSKKYLIEKDKLFPFFQQFFSSSKKFIRRSFTLVLMGGGGESNPLL